MRGGIIYDRAEVIKKGGGRVCKGRLPSTGWCGLWSRWPAQWRADRSLSWCLLSGGAVVRVCCEGALAGTPLVEPAEQHGGHAENAGELPSITAFFYLAGWQRIAIRVEADRPTGGSILRPPGAPGVDVLARLDVLPVAARCASRTWRVLLSCRLLPGCRLAPAELTRQPYTPSVPALSPLVPLENRRPLAGSLPRPGERPHGPLAVLWLLRARCQDGHVELLRSCVVA